MQSSWHAVLEEQGVENDPLLAIAKPRKARERTRVLH